MKLDLTAKIKTWLHKDIESEERAQALSDLMASNLIPRDKNLGPCPACGTHSRAVVGSVFELHGHTVDDKTTILKVAALLCYECGMVNLFEASAVGLDS